MTVRDPLAYEVEVGSPLFSSNYRGQVQDQSTKVRKSFIALDFLSEVQNQNTR